MSHVPQGRGVVVCQCAPGPHWPSAPSLREHRSQEALSWPSPWDIRSHMHPRCAQHFTGNVLASVRSNTRRQGLLSPSDGEAASERGGDIS